MGDVFKSYCTRADVERVIGYTGETTNVSDQEIDYSIQDASEEVDLITHTIFHSSEDAGTAESGTTGALTDTNKKWSTNEYAGYVLWIYSGTGSDQYARIASNTIDTITLHSSDTLTIAPSSDSKYRIIPDCIMKNVNELIHT